MGSDRGKGGGRGNHLRTFPPGGGGNCGVERRQKKKPRKRAEGCGRVRGERPPDNGKE